MVETRQFFQAGGGASKASTWKNLGNTVLGLGLISQSPSAPIVADVVLGTNSEEMAHIVLDNFTVTAKKVAAGDPEAIGEVSATIFTGLVATKGVGIVSKAGMAAKGGGTLARYSGILRDASKFKGNFGLGKGTLSESLELGKAWVGKGYRVSGNGKAWISKDGLRQFRPSSYKPKLGMDQANFQWRNVNRGRWQGNGHLQIIK